MHQAALSKSVDAFGECFTRAQDEAGRPWAFIPTVFGGTFTNAGAQGARSPYRLFVRSEAGRTSVRLIAESRGAGVLKAMEDCR